MKNDEIKATDFPLLNPLLTIGNRLHDETSPPEVFHEERGQFGVIVDDENLVAIRHDSYESVVGFCAWTFVLPYALFALA